MKISIVIPCYNDGAFLIEAVDSVLQYASKIAEIIIVNDGSTDSYTIEILEKYARQGITVLTQVNSGLGHARNQGIKFANAPYILPLDADNKIKPGYIEQALDLLDAGICDIVYAKPQFIGEDIPERKFSTQIFEGHKLLSYNYIDACAIYRKSVWQAVGGYDEKMPFAGHEDWEFWVASFLAGFKFKFIDDELYEYRIRRSSMITNVSDSKAEANGNYLLVKHKHKILDLLRSGVQYQQFYENDQRNYLRTSAKYFIKSVQRLIGRKK